MSDPVYNVLFLCTRNAARSLMAEAILNAEGRGRFRAFSAGSPPVESPHPFTLDVLRTAGHETGFARTKSWDEFTAPEAPGMDFIFTLSDTAAGETSPVWPGSPVTAHWSIPDPLATEGTEAERHLAFDDVYRMLGVRIGLLLSLPLESVDKLALQSRLSEIGDARDNTRVQ